MVGCSLQDPVGELVAPPCTHAAASVGSCACLVGDLLRTSASPSLLRRAYGALLSGGAL